MLIRSIVAYSAECRELEDEETESEMSSSEDKDVPIKKTKHCHCKKAISRDKATKRRGRSKDWKCCFGKHGDTT